MKSKKSIKTPGKIFISNGSLKGEVNLQWDAVRGAKQYVLQYSKNGRWRHLDIISEPHYSIKRLVSGKKYYFRVAAVYNHGQSSFCKRSEKIIK